MSLYLLEFDFLGKNDKIVNTLFIILSAYMCAIKLYIFAFSKDVKKPINVFVRVFI